jgi:hypothetical protein
MTEERRYDDEEVSRLLARAAAQAERDEQAAEQKGAPKELAPGGLTLAQVQEIATSVGIPANAVQKAAASVARGDLVPTTTRVALGIPYGVARQIELPRMLTDVEWDRVVIRLRETFAAEGRSTREGSIRGWRNGNLRVMLEPTATGSRIRMSTVRGDATIRTQVALGAIAVSATMSGLLTVIPGATGRNWGAVAMMGAMGVVLLVRNVLALPRWAKTRASQMEALSAEVGEIVEGRG